MTNGSPHGDSDVLGTIVDNSGATRVKLLPRRRVEAATQRGIGLSPVFAVMCIDDAITATRGYGGPVGDMRLRPDMAAAAALDAGLLWAPFDQLDQELQPMPTCQRGTLRRIEQAAANDGWHYLMAFEVEFSLFTADRPVELAHDGPGYGLLPFLQAEQFLRDLLADLSKAGIEVEQLHPEFERGQYEVSVAPCSPLAAADRMVLVRLVIQRTALRHGLRASFAPVTTPGAVGNGAHVHLSASTGGHNAFTGGDGPYGLTPAGRDMVAGLVTGLTAAVALLAPSPLSYERLVPGHWSGAYACWGLENREAAVRLVQGSAGFRDSAANVEVKAVDGTANPYLAAAVLLALTQHGARQHTPLPPEVTGDPDSLDEAERRRRGVARLPSDQPTALDLAGASPVLRNALGTDMLDSFIAVHRAEHEVFGNLPVDRRIELLRWRY